jgi:glycosyltransferase involved in cell wall biosynthesis
MRIVVCDYSGHPFQVELSRDLAARGHPVLHLHFADFQTPKGSLTALPEDPPNFHVEGITTGRVFDKRQFLKRRFVEAKVGNLFAARAEKFRAELVVGCNMPLDAQKKLRDACARRGVPFVFWLQDVYSQAIHHYLKAKLGVIGSAIGRYYQHLEGALLRSSDAVVAISDKFMAPLERWGVSAHAVHVIPNWAPLSEIYPVAKDNAWARQHSLSDKLVALYTGTLGLKHDPALLLGLAQASRASGLHVVVVSEGAGANWLAQRKGELGLENLTILPFQPMELYPDVLGAGDMLLAMVGEEAAAFSVPSKILSYLAAGKPIIASIAGDNDAAATIQAAQAGEIVAPGDQAAFAAAAIKLAADAPLRQQRGQSARAFAERRFDISAIGDRFEDIFAEALQARAAQTKTAPALLGDLSTAGRKPAR